MELRAADFCAFCSSSCRSGAPYRNILIFSGRVRLFFTPRFCLSLPFRHPLFFMTVEQSTLWADERLGLLLCALGSTEIFVMVRVLLHSLSRCGFVSVHTAGGIEKCYSPCCARGCAAGCKAAKCIETCGLNLPWCSEERHRRLRSSHDNGLHSRQHRRIPRGLRVRAAISAVLVSAAEPLRCSSSQTAEPLVVFSKKVVYRSC